MTMKRPMVITTTTMILNRVETKSLGLTFGTINCNETTMMVYYLESRVSRHHGSRRRVLENWWERSVCGQEQKKEVER